MVESQGGSAGSPVRPGTVRAPEFPADLEWLNVNEPLTIRQLRGKIVILDFWTYCCINCMHALEDLKGLERKYRRELVVIGVHTGKFHAEKSIERIREAVLRLQIDHPVVNDGEMRIWQEYAVRAWPSFLLIDPRGMIVGAHSGERLFEPFDRVIGQMIRYFDSQGAIRREPLALRSEAQLSPTTGLSFPGKVLADQDGGRLFVADTNHNRIVVASLADGSVLSVYGSGTAGLADGPADAAQFTRPHGMALDGSCLYVADTGNHAVRCVDLDERCVSTVVGNGHQDEEWNGAPTSVEGKCLNSPWDLEVSHGVLFIAMAGSHQVYGVDLEGGYVAAHAGSGREDHVDGPLMAAMLAQPSGITTDGQSLFVADSESSSVRAVSLDPRGGHVRTVVGKGLFDFGDQDGDRSDVRLQHPCGIAWVDGTLFVADTFNNKIKAVGLPSCSAQTLAGSGAAGLADGRWDEARFHEPGGVSHATGMLYVADTNNHAVRTVDLDTGAVATFSLRGLKPPETASDRVQ